MPHYAAHPLGFGPDDHQVGWRRAIQLYRWLVGGGTLMPLPNTGLILRDGEQVYGAFPLEFAQHWAAEVPDIPSPGPVFLLGGLVAGRPGAIAGEVIDRARARRKVAKVEEPQWRYPILTNVVFTNRRTLCWLDGQWGSFYHSKIMQLNVDPPAYRVVLVFRDCDCDPTRLRGPAALWYGVALASLVYPPAVFSTLPAFAPFAAPPANG
jgi:hypothetical protein